MSAKKVNLSFSNSKRSELLHQWITLDETKTWINDLLLKYKMPLIDHQESKEVKGPHISLEEPKTPKRKLNDESLLTDVFTPPKRDKHFKSSDSPIPQSPSKLANKSLNSPSLLSPGGYKSPSRHVLPQSPVRHKSSYEHFVVKLKFDDDDITMTDHTQLKHDIPEDIEIKPNIIIPPLFKEEELNYGKNVRENLEKASGTLNLEVATKNLAKWTRLPIYAAALIVKRAIAFVLSFTFPLRTGIKQKDVSKWKYSTNKISSKALLCYCIDRLKLDFCRDAYHAMFRALLDTNIDKTLKQLEDLQKENKSFDGQIQVSDLPSPQDDLLRTELRMSQLREIIGLVIELHPGLQVLREDQNFCPYYIDTVALRICRDGFARGKYTSMGLLTLNQFHHCGLLESLEYLEHHNDASERRDAFCYEHFYVIYCKFWELDSDHDLLLGMDDIKKYSISEYPSITSYVARYVSQFHQVPLNLQRELVTGKVLPDVINESNKHEVMTFLDFACYMFSEEDKKHPSSIRYWFSVLDVDNDGVLSECEIMNFYQEVQAQIISITQEAFPFNSYLSELLDMIGIQSKVGHTRVEVKLSQLLKDYSAAASFFDSLVGAHGFLRFLNKESEDKIEKIDDLQRRGGIERTNGIILLNSVSAAPDPETRDEKCWHSRRWDKFATQYYIETVQNDQNASEYESDSDDYGDY